MLTTQPMPAGGSSSSDDEEGIRTFVATVLQDTGFVVECAADGHEALRKIDAGRPDLVLLDLMVPELDGWGVLEQLRLKPDPPPVVVLSALAEKHRIPQVRTCEKVSAA